MPSEEVDGLQRHLAVGFSAQGLGFRVGGLGFWGYDLGFGV